MEFGVRRGGVAVGTIEYSDEDGECVGDVCGVVGEESVFGGSAVGGLAGIDGRAGECLRDRPEAGAVGGDDPQGTHPLRELNEMNNKETKSCTIGQAMVFAANFLNFLGLTRSGISSSRRWSVKFFSVIT